MTAPTRILRDGGLGCKELETANQSPGAEGTGPVKGATPNRLR